MAAERTRASYLLAGVDEAGLGPNLGPLCLAAASVEVGGPLPAARAAPPNLWALLPGVATADPAGNRRGGLLVVADSKAVYGPHHDTGPLEEAVFAFLRAIDPATDLPRTAGDLLRRLGVPLGRVRRRPWYAAVEALPIPRRAVLGVARKKGDLLRAALDAAGIRPAGLRAVALPEAEFNHGIDRTANKATLHASLVTGLIRSTVGRDGPDAVVECDRLGGRVRYGPVLARRFPGASFRVLDQEEEYSAYRVRWRGRTLDVSFRVKGESHAFLVALASMTAKYVRELFVGCLNAFFLSYDPTLRPTAGYPLDARRFLRETAALRTRLGIRDHDLVRCR